ncbi:hypothetical protein F2P81_018490 [Scophthalmus maximus]|uniref:Uncharacterized protein n=1 Tax=Scophthalmus maximus TaxID=52904 RepID=A0A6A4SAI5_SCOMX|nr:hypothetical protein F2P81_018490 [Scophthalmus maximus]
MPKPLRKPGASRKLMHDTRCVQNVWSELTGSCYRHHKFAALKKMQVAICMSIRASVVICSAPVADSIRGEPQEQGCNVQKVLSWAYANNLLICASALRGFCQLRRRCIELARRA